MNQNVKTILIIGGIIGLALLVGIFIITGIRPVITTAPATSLPAHEREERPEIGIALTYASDVVMVGAEVKFSIWLRTKRDTSGGAVVVGIEKGAVPMSTMMMMGGMVEAVEETPGNYTLKTTFREEGDYIVHVHFRPRGGGMMAMMENHADFGPLRVYRTPPDILVPEKVDIVIADHAYDPNQHEAFVPEILTVKVGTMVTWRNDDISSHTITDHEYGWTSPLLNPGETWSYTFDKPGVYHYHCNPHLWMVGTIVVK